MEPVETVATVTSEAPQATAAATKITAAAAAAPMTGVQDEPAYEDLELSNIRKVIAKRLLFSKTTIPHSYVTTNCVTDKIVQLRKEMIKNNQKVSLNDFIIKAIALALRVN